MIIGLTFFGIATLLEIFEDYGTQDSQKPNRYSQNFNGTTYILALDRENNQYKGATLYQQTEDGKFCIYQTIGRQVAHYNESYIDQFLKAISRLDLSFKDQIAEYFLEKRKQELQPIKKYKP